MTCPFTRRRWPVQSGTRLLAITVVTLIIAALVSNFAFERTAIPTIAPGPPLTIGTHAPDFTLQAVRGNPYRLADLRGQVVLLSFINTQYDVSGEQADVSRSQIVFLKSMHTQYSPQGVHVLTVDASPFTHASSQDELINFTYDHDLPFPLVYDEPSMPTAMRYGIRTLPTTLLIDRQGIVVQRWEGFASAPALAFALQEALGKPILPPAERSK